MQQATKQPAVLLVHDYYQVPGGEDVVVANEKHLLETHGHAAALYARRNEEISRMGALEKIRSALGMFFSIRTYREVRRSIRENRISLVHVHNTLPLIGPACITRHSARAFPWCRRCTTSVCSAQTRFSTATVISARTARKKDCTAR